ncbi:MAG TPA: VWA domain-containing protein [Pyrinomonadaceae bacterium]|jgi:VWFA-related protein|nr:VWA domain-containing protein [Pyrinomonadaceae bacterium]
MKKHSSVAISLLFSLFVSVLAQQPSPQPPGAQQDNPPQDAQSTPTKQKEDVVRISVNLVQVDAVVTDSDGRQVTDLKAEDFEIFEDGKPQQILNSSYIARATLAPRTPATAENKNAPPAPPVRLRPDQVRRAIALVVDDLGLSFESSHYVRDALRKFVDEQMLPGDLVAIIRTGAGMGALQQFTADKRLLYAAIERVRFNVSSRSINAFAPVGDEIRLKVPLAQGTDGTPRLGADLVASLIKQPGKELNEFREEIFSVGTLGALNFIVRGLRELPGRKSVVLFSDGFKMYSENDGSQRIIDSMQRLTDLANRASVVFYTIDPRGLQPLTMTAADNLSGPFAVGNPKSVTNTFGDLAPNELMADIENRLRDRNKEFFESQQGLSYLAQQTGGFLVKNTNDISGAVRRVLNEDGYYLLGYRPDEATFKAPGSSRSFRKISVKVKRPGLRVRTRTGFYGITDEQARLARPATADGQLYAAITSPFSSGGVPLRMTSLFGYDAKKGSFAQSLLHIDARKLTFEEEKEGIFKGFYKTRIDVMAITFGDNGVIIDQDDRVHTIRLPAEDYKRSVEAGFVYSVTLPIKKPGAYQLRIAVRDTATGRVGSANQLIEIPDIKKGRLVLSGITMRGTNQSLAARTAAAATAPVAGQIVSQSENKIDNTDPQAGRAVRKLRGGMVLEYAYYIYNARMDKAARRPQLETQIRLFRDGQQVYAGKVREYNGAAQAEGGQLVAGGALKLKDNIEPGEYVLQVLVTDKLAKDDKYRMATQWIDFDIVR